MEEYPQVRLAGGVQAVEDADLTVRLGHGALGAVAFDVGEEAGKKRVRNIPLGGSGSGSDVDAGAGSGAEMSESGKSKKLKLNPPPGASRGGTPQGSRAASPVAGSRSFSGSRASSPEGARGKSNLL
ncbi:uncharacterized protein CDV56_102782 [Aspergillus thermomutatus]|uniref:Uncharacterized protein n=1 Tax=Aspergillus thermomutatus TaxID=41047 RepID=A0A397G2M3_ASPTH|nr:uncharacterized protein CDV56_102782 [Aspergillus thermomutatus]RHZ45215.1 hypothetical protein CDV56_102782 [Aspergillus thermomutatus]